MEHVISLLRNELSSQRFVLADAETKLKNYPDMNKEFRDDFNEKIKTSKRLSSEFEKAIEILSPIAESDIDFVSDEDDIVDEHAACDICGLTDSHAIDCPEDDSPSAEYKRNGYG